MDLRDVPSLEQVLATAARAKEAFASLPATVRDACGNDPVKLLKMMDSPEGAQRLKNAGLGLELPQQTKAVRGETPPSDENNKG